MFTYGVKRAGLPGNPVRATDKRREPQRAALDTYSVAEVARPLGAAEGGAAIGAPPATATPPRMRRTWSWCLAASTGLRGGRRLALA